MLMAIGELFNKGWVEWVSAMTYQAASGSGANNMRELINGMGVLRDAVQDELADPASAILEIDKKNRSDSALSRLSYTILRCTIGR